MTDPISDMLTRMRNALAVNKSEAVLPFSKMKLAIAEILKAEGYLADISVLKSETGKNQEEIKIIFKYRKPKKPAILGLKRISKPGRRVYVTFDKLPRVLNDLGIAIISTSQGLMTNRDAKKRKLGGEVVCEVY